MGSRRLPTALTGLALALWLSCAPAFAQTTNRIPVQATLVKSIEADRVRIGDSVLASVAVEWKGPHCQLRKGAILQGRVVAADARSKTNKNSSLALLFENGQCGSRDMRPLPLTLVAVVAPNPSTSEGLYEGEQTQPLSEAPGLGIGGATPVGPALGGSGGGGLRSVQGALATTFSLPPRAKQPKAVLPGQVIGLGSIKLEVGTGAEGSSVLSNAKHEMRLEVGSQFVLVPRLEAVNPSKSASVAPAGPAASISNPTSAASSTAEPNISADETEICSPPRCSLAFPVDENTAKTAKAIATVSVKDLGYPLPPTREMVSLDYEAAISYLGNKELLFTFNPHQLVPRVGPEPNGHTARIIRGVLINLATMKVARIVDWRVQDDMRYLWSIGQDKVLVHSGNELRLYGPGLKLEQKLVLGNPLAFVRASPSGAYIAVGILQERHSEAIHRQLAEAENREPEEDVQVRVVDANLRVLTTVVRSSREAKPVLSDQGEVRIPTIGKNRWRIVEYTWAGQRRVLAQLSSTCVPEAGSLRPNLLFVVGCDSQATGKWYRVLGPDGKPVLKGLFPAEDLNQTVTGSVEGGAFAVGVAKFVRALTADPLFHATDLQSEYVGVYEAENGRRLFGVTISSPVPTEQTYALSPTANQLAVLGEDQISLYAVPGAVEAQK
jgi:hypothetical protein